MEKQSHIVISRIVRGQLQQQYGIQLAPGSFTLGNILPDLIPAFLYRPHFLRYCRNYVQRLIRSLLPRSESVWNDCLTSLMMGVLCHFYTDFFCYVHTNRFHGGLRLHLLYEKQLHRFLLDHLSELETPSLSLEMQGGLGMEDIWVRFEAQQERYYKSTPSLDNDLRCAVLSCVEAIALLSESAKKRCEPEEEFVPLQRVL